MLWSLIKRKGNWKYDDDYKYKTDENSIVKINPRYDNFYLNKEEELSVNEKVQKQFVKEHWKQIRIWFILIYNILLLFNLFIYLTFYLYNLIFIEWNKNFTA